VQLEVSSCGGAYGQVYKEKLKKTPKQLRASTWPSNIQTVFTRSSTKSPLSRKSTNIITSWDSGVKSIIPRIGMEIYLYFIIAMHLRITITSRYTWCYCKSFVFVWVLFNVLPCFCALMNQSYHDWIVQWNVAPSRRFTQGVLFQTDCSSAARYGPAPNRRRSEAFAQ